MVFKKYVCKGCGNTEEFDLEGKFTFPQCPKCDGIMSEPIEYDTPMADFIPALEVLWYKHYPEVPVQVQLIYNNHKFKFRWFNGPDVEQVKHNSEFMKGYNEVCEQAGIPKRKRSHKRVFKQYHITVPLEHKGNKKHGELCENNDS